MTNTLSYRIGDPRKPKIPLQRVKALGIPCLEIVVPADADASEIKMLLADNGLRAGTVSSPCPITKDEVFDIFDNFCGKAAVLGAPAIFTSVKHGTMPYEEACERMRRVGDIAAKHGVKIGMETHPPMCENSTQALRTMAAIRHPNIGINYDTANVYYYNHDIDTVKEAEKTAPHVVSVHLKDTMGGFHDEAFPEFGKGVVDFAGIFRAMNAQGFHGPFTMELEGPLLSTKDPVVMEGHVRACVEHLRGLGLVP